MSNSFKAFICYRRGDAFIGRTTAGEPDYSFVKRIQAALAKLGFTEIYLDIDPIFGSRALHHFENRAFDAIKTCDLFVAVIGSKWQDLFRQRAAENTRDAALREIQTAAKYEKPALPILVDGAIMPKREILPKDTRDFIYQHAISLASTDTIETIAEALEEATGVVENTHKIGDRWWNIYVLLCIAVYYFCSINTHVVGLLEYGWAPWLGMSGVWSAFFLWPIFFLPFVFIGLYRPLTTLVRFVAIAPNLRTRRIYLSPLVLSTVLAGAAWALEVYDARQVPWSIYAELPQPGCASGPSLPNNIAILPPREQRRWQVLMDLSTYDKADHLKNNLRGRYGGRDVPFWLNDKCWPNVFFYLTSPIYFGLGTDSSYLTDRLPVQQSFSTILNNKARIALGIPNSWSAWAYRLSFFILVWLGISGVMMACFYTMVALRDPSSDAIISLPREDAALCLTYSLGTFMTWLPFRMNTEYFKFLYTCPDPTTCEFDIALYLPDCLLAIMLLIGYVFVTVSLFVQHRRVALSFLGFVMIVTSMSLSILVYYFKDSIARLTELWQFYVLVAIPSVIILFACWFLFDPARVHSEDFERKENWIPRAFVNLAPTSPPTQRMTVQVVRCQHPQFHMVTTGGARPARSRGWRPC